MTFNLRYNRLDLSNHACRVRKEAVAYFIADHALDLIGTQEGEAYQLLDLRCFLPTIKVWNTIALTLASISIVPFSTVLTTGAVLLLIIFLFAILWKLWDTA